MELDSSKMGTAIRAERPIAQPSADVIHVAPATLRGRADPWPLSPSGDWAEDNRRGREFAKALVERMRREDAPNLLGFAIKGMIESGQHNGLTVGFSQQIAEKLLLR